MKPPARVDAASAGAVPPGRLITEMRVRRGGFQLDACLAAEPGECVAVIGPNGSGKSTLLQAIAGSVSLASGLVALGGRSLTRVEPGGEATSLPAAQRRIGLLTQEPLLFPHMSARTNVAYGPRVQGASKREALEVADELLGLMGAGALAELRPAALSGGERQRVALARVLAAEPDLVLLDEAFGALDVAGRPQIRSALTTWLRRHQVAVLFATHDLLDVTALATRAVVLEGGRIVDDGPARSVLFAPRSSFAAQLAGLNLVRGRWRGGEFSAEGWEFTCSGDGFVGDGGAALAAIPYAAVRLGAPGRGRRARVAGVEAAGGLARVSLQEPMALVADVPLEHALELAPGDDVDVVFDADHVRCYGVERMVETGQTTGNSVRGNRMQWTEASQWSQ